jgi:hypothetical protein
MYVYGGAAGVGLSDVGSSAMSFGLTLMGMMEKHFPERLYKYALNPLHRALPTLPTLSPSIFRTICLRIARLCMGRSERHM